MIESPCPRTLETASLDESELTETLTRTSFKPPEFRFQLGKELSEDRLSEADELFNKEIKEICDKLQFLVACGSIFTSSYKIELCESAKY